MCLQQWRKKKSFKSLKESWPKMFCRQCRQNVLRHVCYSKSSNKLEAERRLLEMDHKNRMSINWLHTVCRPWAGQSAQRHGKSLQSCPILCDPMDCSPPGSSAHGILQAKILEWVVTPSSRGSSWPRDRTRVSYAPCIGRRVLYHSHSVLPKALRAKDSS